MKIIIILLLCCSAHFIGAVPTQGCGMALTKRMCAFFKRMFADVVDENGATAIHRAVKEGDLEAVLKAVRAHSSLVNALDQNGYSALHLAADLGKADIAQSLIDGGAFVDIKNPEDDATPLHDAVLEGHINVVKILVAAHATVDARDKDGLSPLHIAAEHGYFGMVQFLLASGASADIKDAEGWTPLHHAAAKSVIMYPPLFARNANRNSFNEDRSTRVETRDDHLECVKFLLAGGASTNVYTDHGDTPLDLAKERNYFNIAKFLEDYAKAEDSVTIPLEHDVRRGETV